MTKGRVGLPAPRLSGAVSFFKLAGMDAVFHNVSGLRMDGSPFPAFRLAVGGRARVWCGSRGLSRRWLGQSRGALSVVLLSLTSRPEARLSVATPVLFARGCNVGGCGCVLLRLAASGCCAPASGASGACDTSPPLARCCVPSRTAA